MQPEVTQDEDDTIKTEEQNIALSVNLNKIALVRNSRDGNYPDLRQFADICITGGAQGLTVHPRPNQRHIRPGDVFQLSDIAKAANIEFNIEGNPFAPAINDYPGLLSLVEQTKPTQCTLVPDSDQQKTSDHGFDLHRDFDALVPIVQKLKEMGVRVSLFMDPDPAQIKLVKKLGADRIELYTGPFAWAFENDRETAEILFAEHCEAAKTAQSLGLGINAGHDLNLHNMKLYRKLPGLQEVSIGHALTVDALLMGFDTAVKAYRSVCG